MSEQGIRTQVIKMAERFEDNGHIESARILKQYVHDNDQFRARLRTLIEMPIFQKLRELLAAMEKT